VAVVAMDLSGCRWLQLSHRLISSAASRPQRAFTGGPGDQEVRSVSCGKKSILLISLPPDLL
jgi:hypothetical protein